MLVGIVVIFFFGMLINVVDNLIGIEVKQNNIDVEEGGFFFLLGLNYLFGGKVLSYIVGILVIILKCGYDIFLEGEVNGNIENVIIVI